MGYVHVGVLLAVLEVARARLVLRVRPAIARMVFGVENLDIGPDEGVAIFPAHKLGQQGIEARLPGRPSYYFWTDRRHEVLNSLTAAGFQVSEEEQRCGPGRRRGRTTWTRTPLRRASLWLRRIGSTYRSSSKFSPARSSNSGYACG
jgi:hypothetical protein